MSKGHMIMLGGLIEMWGNGDDPTINGPYTKVSKTFWTSIKRSAGGHRIASHLREEGYDVEVLDFWPQWTRLQIIQFFQQRVREDTLVVGISVMFPFGNILADKEGNIKIKEMLQTIEYLKDIYPQIKFIGGSQNLSAIIEYDLDYYVTGYAEHAVVELMKYFKREFNTLKIKQHVVNGKTIKVIDCQNDYPAFPMPNASVKYEDRDYIQPQEVLMIELARGCKFKCKFCNFPMLGVKDDYSRCGESLKEELLDNYNRWGTTHYTVSDETINDSPKKLAKHAKAIRELPFQPHLAGYVRADLLVNKPDTWEDIYDMGLRSHFYGLETFHQPSGKYVGKGIDPDKLKKGLLKVRDWFRDKEAGRGDYNCEIAMMLGLPEETKETFLNGLDWIKNNFPGYPTWVTTLYIAGDDQVDVLGNPSEFERTWKEEDVFREMSMKELTDLRYPKQTAQVRPEHPTDAEKSNLSPSANPNAPLSPKQLRELDAFREMSAEKSNPISPYVEGQLFGRGQVKWAHDTMNIWEAYQILSEIINDPNSVRNQISGPPPWDYHRYLTVNKYTIDDIYNKKFGEDGFHQLSDKDLDDHVNFISEYIDKKLNKR
jgi:radical SAM superfamily enzyme YgiQ (UPF0313 family)